MIVHVIKRTKLKLYDKYTLTPVNIKVNDAIFVRHNLFLTATLGCAHAVVHTINIWVTIQQKTRIYFRICINNLNVRRVCATGDA